MNHRTEILPGVYLTAVQSDKFKTGCFSLNLLRPMKKEEAAANALIPSVLLRGSETCPDIASISAKLDELYGASVGTLVRKKGEVQLVGFYCDYVQDEYVDEPVFAPVMAFLAELLLHPRLENGAFPEAVVDSEKLNLENAMLSRINDKRTYAASQLIRTMCAGQPYGIPRIGEPDDLKNITAKSLYAHYRDLLATSRVELFYMGSLSPAAVTKVLQTVLAELPRAEVFVPVGTTPAPAARPVQEKTERLDVTQGKLSLGFFTDITAKDPRYPALVLAATVFGGGATSKLFTNVREKMSLCYYASASFEKFKGVLSVSSGVEFSKLETAKTEILRQLEACKAGDITDDELESARGYLVSDLKIAMDSPGRLDDYYMGQILLEQDGTMEDLASAIARVTKQEAADAIQALRLDTIYALEGVTA
ncbi:MAG: insulinase family protein [Firmicutes bacterium]|nr:insulinase family protein [Bacillota bacterium]